MTRQEQGNKGKGLPLPSPTSPRDLDDRILTYARHKADDGTPARPGLLGHPWATGLVTASVVALALFITEPEQRSPSLQSIPAATEGAAEQASPPAPTHSLREFHTEMDMASEAPLAKAAKAPASQGKDELSGVSARRDRTGSAEPELQEDAAVTLARCAQLLREGRVEEASALYQQLRERCPGCNLPDTLQAAIDNNLD